MTAPHQGAEDAASPPRRAIGAPHEALRRPWLCGLAVSLVTLLAAPSAGATTLTRGPYLQLLTPRSVTIVWNTDTPAACSLAIRPADGTGGSVIQGGGTDTVCAIAVDGLGSGTSYAYTPRADDVPLGDESLFRTDDPNRSRYTFLVLGDSGSGGHDQLSVRDAMLKTPVDFLIHTGDMIYEDGLPEDFNPEFFNPYRELLRHYVFWPTLGNHDVHTDDGAPWRAAFYTPANNPSANENYYSFDFGTAHVAVLNSNNLTNPGSPQYLFLDQDLAASTALWKFVVFHYPAYSSGFHGSNLTIQANLLPLFDKYGVDIVLTGHDHDYERTRPLMDNKPAVPGTGTVYIVTGGGGKDARPVGSNWFTAYSESVVHFTRVTIDGTTLIEQMIREDGTVGDSMMLVKGAPPPLPRCGDDLVNQPGEQCDGADHPACPGACLPDCTCAPVCGDGHADPPTEACDGSDDAACPGLCLSDCRCGDPSRFMTLVPVADTFIDAVDRAVAWDHGIAPLLSVNQRAAFAYLKFDVPSLPGPVTAARLTVVANSASPDGGTIYPVRDSSWPEGNQTGLGATSAAGPGLKWVDVDTDGNGVVDLRDTSPYVPDFTDAVGGIGAVVVGGTYSADVTPAFRGGPGTYTLTIKNDSQNGTLYFSRETSQGPELRLELGAPGITSTTTTTSTTAPVPTTSTTTAETATSTTTSSTTTSEPPTTSTTSTSLPLATTTTLPGCDPNVPSSCDDGDACTADACDADGQCHHVAVVGLDGVSCRVETLADALQGVSPADVGSARVRRQLAARVRAVRAALLAARSTRGRRAADDLARTQRLLAGLGRQVDRLERQGTLARPVADRMLALTASAERELRPLRGARDTK